MHYHVISNVADKVELVIDDEMTVGDIRSVIAAMIDADLATDTITLTYKGRVREVDEEVWNTVVEPQPHSVAQSTISSGAVAHNPNKIFVFVVKGKKQARGGSEVCSEALRAALPTRASAKEEEEAKRQQALQMEPLIDLMVSNPGFFDMMISMQPELKSLLAKHPEMERELRNPETIKSMMMAQIDPDRKREMNRSAQLQMAQLSTLPGGSQMLGNLMDNVAQEISKENYNNVDAGPQDEPMTNAQPDPSKESNNEALPNPWATPAPSTASAGPGAPGARGVAFAPGTQSFPTAPFGFPGVGNSGPPNPFLSLLFPPGGAGGVPQPSPLGPLFPATENSPAMLSLLPQLMAQQMMPSGTSPAPAGLSVGPRGAIPGGLVSSGPTEMRAGGMLNDAPEWGEKLALMREMGFAGTQEAEELCHFALSLFGGDVDAAVLWIAQQNEDHSESP